MPRKSTAERSQAYRDRLKEDPVKYEERLKRDRERYLRKKERGVVKPIADVSKREQRKRRRQLLNRIVCFRRFQINVFCFSTWTSIHCHFHNTQSFPQHPVISTTSYLFKKYLQNYNHSLKTSA